MITKEQKIEAIRLECIKANPSILDLVFGCEVMGKDNKKLGVYLYKHLTGKYYSYDKNTDEAFWFMPDEVKILGRDIRLSDVLLVIGKDESDLANGCSCNNCHISKWKIIHSDITGSASGWNLKEDSLTKQSQETIDFLYELIYENTKKIKNRRS